MGIWKTTKAAFAPGISVPPDARRLSAVDELALSASLRALRVGERGWITLSEARALFSPMADQYAFGEMDEVGKTSLAAFAAESDHRSAFDLMPIEGRVYFTRKANLLPSGHGRPTLQDREGADPKGEITARVPNLPIFKAAFQKARFG